MWSSDRRTVLAAIAAVVALALAAAGAGDASASFANVPHANATFAAGTLAPPTNPGVSVAPCVLLAPGIKVTWTATASTWADGYQVGRSLTSGGPYTFVNVAGQTTTSYTDNSLTALTTYYYYVVRATKAGWRSPLTAQVSLSTLTC